MKKRIALIIISIIYLLPVNIMAQIPQTEYQALVEFFNTTNGPAWVKNDNWAGPAGTEDTWFGVTIANDPIDMSDHVIKIELPDNGLQGNIPPALGNLVHLNSLDLSYNNFRGNIPVELKSLINLQAQGLDFRYNSLYASDQDLVTFLNQKQVDSDWQSTQTLPPANIVLIGASNNTVTVTWDPIIFSSGTGHYEILYSTLPDDNNALVKTTNSKTDTSITLDNVTQGETYYIRIFTISTVQVNNAYTLDIKSLPSPEKSILVDSQNTQPLPVADAGQNQNVRQGDQVTLDGTKSLGNNTAAIASYSWMQESGFQVTLLDAGTAMATFTAPVVSTPGELLVFKLTVTDVNGMQAEDRVEIRVYQDNLPPVADAGGSKDALPGSMFTLDGNNSYDPDNDPITFSWTQVQGVTVTLSDPSSASPTFTIPQTAQNGDLFVFELTVTDSNGFFSTDKATVKAGSGSTGMPPEAHAGQDQFVKPGDLVTLPGNLSMDPDNDIATYKWEQLSGTTVVLDDSTIATPTFTAPTPTGQEADVLEFELTVTDQTELLSHAQVRIFVVDNSPPDKPTAVSPLAPDANQFPGKSAVISGTSVILQASAFSDQDENDTLYKVHWMVRQADSIYLRPDYDSSFSKDVVADTSSGNPQDLTQYTVTGLKPGMKYFWQVGYEDNSGSGFISWSKEYSFIVGEVVDSQDIFLKGGTRAVNFKMITLPVWTEDSNMVGTFHIDMDRYFNDFRIGTYEAFGGGYWDYGSGDLMVVPGRAYWYLGRYDQIVNITGVPVSLDSDVDIQLNFSKETGDGWNMIGSPNAANYLWRNIIVIKYDDQGHTVDTNGNVIDQTQFVTISQLADDNPWISKKLWKWEGELNSYTTAVGIEKYRGYWVKCKSNNLFLRFPKTAQVDNVADLTNNGQSTGSVKALRSVSRPAVEEIPPSPPSALGSGSFEDSVSVCFINSLFSK